MEIRSDLAWTVVAPEHIGAFGLAWVNRAMVPTLICARNGSISALYLDSELTRVAERPQRFLQITAARLDVTLTSMAPVVSSAPPPGALVLDGAHFCVLAKWREGLAVCDLKTGEVAEATPPRSGVYSLDWSIVMPGATSDRPDVLYASGDGRASS